GGQRAYPTDVLLERQADAAALPFAMALAHLGRLTGDNRVALVVYDGLPQDSIIETDVAAVIQSTRQAGAGGVPRPARPVAGVHVLWPGPGKTRRAR
ncbi:hypothetical protein FK513_28650, partial [Klebsiella pneumoniae]|nr:hypothetical protein [Klebsiella pneumoniae]